MGKQWKKMLAVWLTFVVLLGTMDGKKAEASAADTVKSACAAALKATGNKDKVKYQSTSADFDGIPYKLSEKLSAIFFITNDNGVYNICVTRAKTKGIAKELYQSFASYKKQMVKNPYLNDYSKAEQSVIKNAVYGKKGKFVWYISMSSKKKNLEGEEALKKTL